MREFVAVKIRKSGTVSKPDGARFGKTRRTIKAAGPWRRRSGKSAHSGLHIKIGVEGPGTCRPGAAGTPSGRRGDIVGPGR